MVDNANKKVHTSATVLMLLDGKAIGVGQNATGTENFNVIPVPQGFGSIMPLEHVITEWSATVTMDKFYLRNKSLTQAGVAATGSGILNMRPINISFLNADDQSKKLTNFLNCTLQSREFTISQNAIVGERATWLALNVEVGSDEVSEGPTRNYAI